MPPRSLTAHSIQLSYLCLSIIFRPLLQHNIQAQALKIQINSSSAMLQALLRISSRVQEIMLCHLTRWVTKQCIVTCLLMNVLGIAASPKTRLRLCRPCSQSPNWHQSNKPMANENRQDQESPGFHHALTTISVIFPGEQWHIIILQVLTLHSQSQRNPR